tara:strand:- start:2974 stop:3609 length:636 start_codon:yes stop_codon:yes gene_type:complete
MAINHSSLGKVLSDIKSISPKTNLLVVSKNRSQEDVIELLKKGYRLFGENRVQEASQKFEELNEKFNFDLHLIGPLQTNKVELALKTFTVIQSLDRIKLVETILKFINKKTNVKTQKFYIQVNIGDEEQKSGVAMNEVINFYNYCSNLLTVEGFMCIPPEGKEPEFFFEKLINIKNNIDPSLKVSMGMSNDYKLALKKNSDIIRIGSMIFK